MNETAFFDKYLSNQWNQLSGRNESRPEDFWPVCRELEKHGLLEANQSDVAAVKIGPFRIASTSKAGDVLLPMREEIIPYLIDRLSGDSSLETALSTLFELIFQVLLGLMQNSVTVKDKQHWLILVALKKANKASDFPAAIDLADSLGIDQSEIETAIDELSHYRRNSILPVVQLVRRESDGTLRSLV